MIGAWNSACDDIDSLMKSMDSAAQRFETQWVKEHIDRSKDRYDFPEALDTGDSKSYFQHMEDHFSEEWSILVGHHYWAQRYRRYREDE